MLGAGMVILQPSTNKFVIVYDTKKQYWFLPKGRKDLGESLEMTALREAYEEVCIPLVILIWHLMRCYIQSGYQVEFLPLHIPSYAPAPPGNPEAYHRLNTEPIFVTLTSWRPRGRRQYGGEYLTSWYVGQIPEDAVYIYISHEFLVSNKYIILGVHAGNWNG
jgi:8-oxo-dGTP pyrophosphatase MutT (NUDIX family)